MGQRSSGRRQKIRSSTEQEHSEAAKCFPAAGKTFPSVEKTFSDSEKASPVGKKVFPTALLSGLLRCVFGMMPEKYRIRTKPTRKL